MSKFNNRDKSKTEEELAKIEADLDKQTPPTNEDPEDTHEEEDIQEEIIETEDEHKDEDQDNEDPEDAGDEQEEENNDEGGEESEEEDKPEKKTVTSSPEVTPKNPDYKDKFINSTRESLTQIAKNKKLTEAIDEASNLELTDEEFNTEVVKRGLNPEMLSETEKIILRESISNSKKFEKVKTASEEGRKIDEWATKVDSFLEDENTLKNFPTIAGNEDEFRKFVMKPTRRGVDLEDLVSAFSFGYKPPVKKTGNLLLSNSNGRAMPTKPAKVTAEDLSVLRRTNPKRYRQIIESGKINEVEF